MTILVLYTHSIWQATNQCVWIADAEEIDVRTHAHTLARVFARMQKRVVLFQESQFGSSVSQASDAEAEAIDNMYPACLALPLTPSTTCTLHAWPSLPSHQQHVPCMPGPNSQACVVHSSVPTLPRPNFRTHGCEVLMFEATMLTCNIVIPQNSYNTLTSDTRHTPASRLG